jgi:hypothetical protein
MFKDIMINIQGFTERYELKNIANYAESRLSGRALPSKTLRLKSE